MEGFILIGGKSRRMGTDKAALAVGGRPMLERAADALSPIATDGIKVVGGSQHAHIAYPYIPDPDLGTDGIDRSGPLVGVYAALTEAKSEWVAVLACDLPFVTADLMKALAGLDRAGLDAVVPLQSDGIPQPLCALYRREPCLRAADELIRGSDLSMRSLIAAVNTRLVEFDTFAGLENAENFFLNVNTPADHSRAISISGP